MKTAMNWNFETSGSEGQCMLFGVNLFDFEWRRTGEKISVKDPLYGQEFTFSVYQAEIDGRSRRFAAGEFSNCVWGFYLEK